MKVRKSSVPALLPLGYGFVAQCMLRFTQNDKCNLHENANKNECNFTTYEWWPGNNKWLRQFFGVAGS